MFFPYLFHLKKNKIGIFIILNVTQNEYTFKAISSDQNMIDLAPPDLAFVTLPINNTLATTHNMDKHDLLSFFSFLLCVVSVYTLASNICLVVQPCQVLYNRGLSIYPVLAVFI